MKRVGGQAFLGVLQTVLEHSLDPGSSLLRRGNEPGDEANNEEGSQIFLSITLTSLKGLENHQTQHAQFTSAIFTEDGNEKRDEVTIEEQVYNKIINV